MDMTGEASTTYRWGVTLDEYNTLAEAFDESPLLQHALLYRARYPGDRNWLVATVTDGQRRALHTEWPFLVRSCRVHSDPTYTPERQRLVDVLRLRLAPEGDCGTCDELRRTGSEWFPSHDPMMACQSGRVTGTPHCTCDTCF